MGHVRAQSPPIPGRQDCWHVYYADVHIGTIALRSGAPVDVDQWGWILGFYPGTEVGKYRDGTAQTFNLARATLMPLGRRCCHIGDSGT